MKNLLHPKWILIINTLPILLLFFLSIGEFQIIKSLLEDKSIQLWFYFGSALGILGIANLVYAIYLIIKKQKVSVIYGLAALLIYVPFLYIYGYYAEDIIPFSIPRWMTSGNLVLYVGTFLMPTLIYALFILVLYFTSELKEHKAWKNFLFAITVPVFWYVFSQIVLPFWKNVGGDFKTHTILIFVIMGTLVFLFFLIRTVFILTVKKSEVWLKYQLAWKIPITIILPLLGLAVNNGLLFNKFSISDSGIFGNFTSYWFYILAIINGILICLPNIENKAYRLFLFVARSISFAYTLYFFLVFLPFLPLSIVAILAFGAGFLMLTPLLLFVIHTNEIYQDFKYLKQNFSNKTLWIFSISGFLILPLIITGTYINDRKVLHETLDYVYTPNYEKENQINTKSLKRTLNVVKKSKNKWSSRGIFGMQTPYLSTYFNWLVLDNLTLSDSKIETIESIFFDENIINTRSENIRNDEVNITNITTQSAYDETQQAWKSWVNLEITNANENNRLAEYATTIKLPVGCWISDYYLYVGDRKEMGILAEKKTAMWVFSQIRNQNRDPGILYYLTGNKVAFRVFPFAKSEVRKTGIEFLHKEPITLNIDGNFVKLGDITKGIATEKIETENLIYIPSKQKQHLKQVERKPYFHFLVDVSNNKENNFSDYQYRIQQAIRNHVLLGENAKISFVNSYVNTIKYDKNWKQNFEAQKFEGGYFVVRAIKQVLIKSYKEQSNTYPVLVMVTDSFQKAILNKDFADYKMAFPENDLFFNLQENGELEIHSLLSEPKNVLANINVSFHKKVLMYQHENSTVSYLPQNSEPSIVSKKDIFNVKQTEIKEKNWKTALTLQGMWQLQIQHPELSDKEWLKLVKYSFTSKIMSPVTSYLVVENEAQKAILKQKQKQVLSSKKSLDVGEDAQRMSEPNMYILIILFGIGWYYFEKRKKRLKA